MTNPLQYIRNYFAARRMKREREARERVEREERQDEALKEFASYLVKKKFDDLLSYARSEFNYPSGGMPTPMTDEDGEYLGFSIPFSAPAWMDLPLEQQLQAAIDREDYETAARLRDEIKNKEA